MTDSRTRDRVYRAQARERQVSPGRRRPWGRHAGRVLAVGVVLLVAACSSVKLGYDNADTLLVASLDGYFDLHGEQKQLVRAHVRELLAWHRTTQLEQYVEILDATERKVGGQVTPDEVLAVHDELQRTLARLGEQAAPALAQLALTLRAAQIDHCGAKLARHAVKARRVLARQVGRTSVDDRVADHAEHAEAWFGSLNDAQRAVMRASLAELTADRQWWVGERELRQRELVTLLRRVHDEQPPAPVAAAWLRSYFAQLRLPAEADRRARVLALRHTNAALIARLINGAGAAQKARLTRKLRAYSQDFSTLATRGS